MRSTKELDLLCWLGPAELVNFIKRQINVRKGWSALGDVALPSWLGPFFIWSLHPSNPNSTASGLTLAVPAQLVWVLARRNSPQWRLGRKTLSKGEHRLLEPAGLSLTLSLPAATHLTLLLFALLHPIGICPIIHQKTVLPPLCEIYCTPLLLLLFKSFPDL